MTKYLVTGAAGFIGFHVARQLCQRGDTVVGVDNFTPYYDVDLKRARAALLNESPLFELEEIDLADRGATEELFAAHNFDVVIHLAAQAGVRYSLENPFAYIDSNIVGMTTILEGCRHSNVKHLVYASSSSVYGSNTKQPFATSDNVDHPVSLYAATKKANELMAHTYSHLFELPTTGLRFFTVYGPWGRPDMALYKFTKAIIAGQAIDIYNNGKMQRDFTYIDDITEGVIRTADSIAIADATWNSEQPNPATSNAPYRIFNIGNNQPVELLRLIEVLEDALGMKAQRNMLPMQPGDVPATYANVDDLSTAVGFKPATSIEQGVKNFVEWYRSYHDAL